MLEATEPTDVDIASVQEECGDLLWYLVGLHTARSPQFTVGGPPSRNGGYESG